MLQLGAWLLSKMKGLYLWVISLGLIATLVSYIGQLMKRRAVRSSEEKADSDKASIVRKAESVESDWVSTGEKVDKLRDGK